MSRHNKIPETKANTSLAPFAIVSLHLGRAHRLAWSPDGRKIAAPMSSGAVEIFDLEGQQSQSLKLYDSSVFQVGWAPSSESLISCSENEVYEIMVPSVRATRVEGLPRKPWFAIAWPPDGSNYAIGAVDGTIVIVNSATRSATRLIRGPQRLSALAWSPNSRFLAAVGETGEIRIWAHVEFELTEIDARNGSSILDCCWAPDSAALILAQRDGAIRVWRGVQKQIETLQRQDSPVQKVAFLKDCTLVTQTAKTIGSWTWPSGRLQAEVSHESDSIWRGLAPSPTEPILAAPSDAGKSLTLFRFSTEGHPTEARPSGELALLSRSPKTPAQLPYEKDLTNAQLTRDGTTIELTPTESKALRLLERAYILDPNHRTRAKDLESQMNGRFRQRVSGLNKKLGQIGLAVEGGSNKDPGYRLTVKP